MSMLALLDGSTSLVFSITSTSQPRIRAPILGTGPGSCHGTVLDLRFIAKGVTSPQCEPMYVCTPAGRTIPFCVPATERLIGCQCSGSVRVAPELSKTSGGFDALYSLG